MQRLRQLLIDTFKGPIQVGFKVIDSTEKLGQAFLRLLLHPKTIWPTYVSLVIRAWPFIIPFLGITLATRLLLYKDPEICSTSCDQVLNSFFSTLFGLPTPLWGIIAWMVYMCFPSFRKLTIVCMCLASLGFVLLQAFIIGQFCPLCCMHAAICFLNIGNWKVQPRYPIVLLCVSLLITYLPYTAPSTPAASVSQRASRAYPPLPKDLAYNWFNNSTSNAVVLRLFCPHCMDLLHQFAASPNAQEYSIIFTSITPLESEVTQSFIAAIKAKEAQGMSARTAITSLIAHIRANPKQDQLLTLRAFAPDLGNYLPQASAEFSRQSAYASTLNLEATPTTLKDKLTAGFSGPLN